MKQQWHSGFDDSSGWGRLIDPVCLFILCQIAGTLWLIAPRKSFAPPLAPSAAVDVHRVEVAGLLDQKSALEKAVKMARQEVQRVAQPVQTAVTEQDRLAAQIRTEEQRVKGLEAELDELARKETETGRKIAAVPPPSSQLGAEAEQLGQQLASKQEEVKRLQLELEQTKGLGYGSGVGSPRFVETSLDPSFVHLIGNRAVPVDGQHYKITQGRLRTTGQEVMVYTKSALGETADEIRKPTSDLANYLQKMNPSKDFLLCLITNDSLAIYPEVRAIAKAKGIKVAWKTNYDSDGVLLFGAGKGKYRVGENQ